MNNHNRSSHRSIPAGLQLYTFVYPEEWRELPETVVCLDGQCDPAPEQLFLSGDNEAAMAAKLYRAIKAVNEVSGVIVFQSP
jgi:hypothetical protein